MYDGNQVLRFESKYKASDLGGLGVELVMRKGTGNYDKDRTIFNYSYIVKKFPKLVIYYNREWKNTILCVLLFICKKNMTKKEKNKNQTVRTTIRLIRDNILKKYP